MVCVKIKTSHKQNLYIIYVYQFFFNFIIFFNGLTNEGKIPPLVPISQRLHRKSLEKIHQFPKCSQLQNSTYKISNCSFLSKYDVMDSKIVIFIIRMTLDFVYTLNIKTGTL